MNTDKLFSWMFFLGVAVVALSCDDEESLNLNLTEVQTLYTPEDNRFVDLKPAQNITETFEWDQAHAQDGSLVVYEVAFDQESGDFTAPFYKIASNGKGVEPRLTLTHADLNRIAELGGAAFFEARKFKWTVLASKGDNVKTAAVFRYIELERPGGFEEKPSALYITGSATEGGSDVAAAKECRQLEPGVFEIMTKLTAGTYKFVDGLSSSARVYYIGEDEGSPVIDMDGENVFEGDDKVYRIKLDFNSLAVTTTEVKEAGFWYCWENMIQYDLDYTGDGIWKAQNVTVNLSAVPWGFEERHKYRLTLNSGGDDYDEWWGYRENDSPGQDGNYGNTPAEYFYAYKIANNDQWNYAWKLDRPAIQGKQADFVLSFNAATPYRMEYVIH